MCLSLNLLSKVKHTICVFIGLTVNNHYHLDIALQAVLRTIVKVLSNEEQALGLQQPVGVGQRPKPMGRS